MTEGKLYEVLRINYELKRNPHIKWSTVHFDSLDRIKEDLDKAKLEFLMLFVENPYSEDQIVAVEKWFNEQFGDKE
jgi:hypothetical protein